MDDMLLEKIDLLRERMHVSYKDARQALEEADGSVVEALVLLENQTRAKIEQRITEQETLRSEVIVKGSELVEQVKALIKQGNITTLRVLHKDELLFELPFNAGVIGVLLLPQLAMLAGIAVLFAQVTIQIDQPIGSASETSCTCDCDCDCKEDEACECECKEGEACTCHDKDEACACDEARTCNETKEAVPCCEAEGEPQVDPE